MKVLKYYGGSSQEIVDHVNKNDIKREDIVQINDTTHCSYIYYYAEAGVGTDEETRSGWF